MGDRGRELVLEATAMDRMDGMDRADFVRVAAGAASTLVATSLAKESLAAEVSGAYLATIAARQPRNAIIRTGSMLTFNLRSGCGAYRM